MAQIIPLLPDCELPSHGIYYVDEGLPTEDPGSIEEPIPDASTVRLANAREQVRRTRMLAALAITCLGLAIGLGLWAFVFAVLR